MENENNVKKKGPSKIQLPHVKPEHSEITPKERLVYLYIKNHWNKKEKRCDPSLATLKKESGISIPTLRKCIAMLEKRGYFKVVKKLKGQSYIFEEEKPFEEISRKFLENKDVNFTEKSLITSSVEFMLDKGETGKIGYTNKELSEIINMPESTISKCIRDLAKRGYIYNGKSDIIDPETGCKKDIKIFDLLLLGQSIVYEKIEDHEDRITNNENEIKSQSEQIKEQKEIIESQNKIIQEQGKEIKSLKNDVRILMNCVKKENTKQKDLILD